jgi:phosphoribosyl 1,2-cyclic phosphodiesterase
MSLSLCVLASGSSGNCTLIRNSGSALMIDAGLSAKEIKRRMETAEGSLDEVTGVCISHEHSDHVAGLATLHQQHQIPIYANRGTSEGMQRRTGLKDVPCRIFSTGQAFTVGSFTVEPFSVPHDAYEPVGFIISTDGVKIGVVTDMGIATNLIRDRLRECRALVVESNHDVALLRDSRRPAHLKQRIMSRQGHLSNDAAAELLTDIAGPHLDTVFLAHLSEDCNRGEIALKTTRRALAKAGHEHVNVQLTYQDKASEVWKAG